MSPSRTSWKSIPGFLVVLTIWILTTESVTAERLARHVTRDPSQQRSHSFDDHSSSNSLNFGDNEFTTENEKKVSHRLVGGHMRFGTTTTITTASPLVRKNKDRDENDNRDDERDEATWDDGLILSSAGNGKEKKQGKTNNNSNSDDDEKKTLSQQVKEGKYGLIQNEIYPSRPKRPGIISYLSNPEVPRDNSKNLGGLDEDDIWLAENHVLVLRGGNFPDHEKDNGASTENIWSPIDDYEAPKRQVKIPPRPEVPPPFPVQLSDEGPVEIIGFNGTWRSEDQDSRYEKESLSGEVFGKSRNGTVPSRDLTSQENATKNLVGGDRDGTIKSGHVPPRNGGIIGPFYPSLPPGAVFVIPPGNQSEYDEDDQSIYYPPPYSFYYKQDNSTPVPPGPLVPGIILPPPPDFFSGSEEKKPTIGKSHSTKYFKRPGSTTPLPKINPPYYPPRKSSAKPYKTTVTTTTTTTSSVGKVSTTKHPSRVTSFTVKPAKVIKYKSTTTGRSIEEPIRVQENSTLPSLVDSTTQSIEDASNLGISEFYTARPNTLTNSVSEKTRTKNRWIPNVSSRPVPLVTYYSSSIPSSVDEPVEATPVSVSNVITKGKERGTTNHASYYFYEEANDDVTTGTTPNPTVYYRTTTEAPYYRIQVLPQQKQQQQQQKQQQQQEQQQREQEKKSYYEEQVAPTQQPPRDYNAELLEPVPKTSSRYQYANSVATTNSVTSSRAKGQRALTESLPPYYEDVTQSPRVQSYYATTKTPSFSGDDERYEYDRAVEPKPIYQYSYESADYSKRGRQQDYKPEIQRDSYYRQDTQQATTRAPETFDEWQDIRDENQQQQQQQQQYDYGESETLAEQEIQRERDNHRYRNRLTVSYETTTTRPIIDITPNPQQSYYTKQDNEEQLLDDVTREYFTNFGKKLRGESLPNTTPIYSKTRVVTARPVYTEVESYNDYENERPIPTYKPPRVKVHYGDQSPRPYSLEDDTRVNYVNPLPSIEPDSEWIPGFDPKQRVNLPIENYQQHHTQVVNQEYLERQLPTQRFSPIRNYAGQRLIEGTNGSPTNFVPLGDSREEDRATYSTRPLSLQGDTAVNYRDPRPPVNPDAEYIDPSRIRDNGNVNNNPDKASYFAYRLPGDGGHFYFLTPRAVGQRQDDNGGYLYPRPRGTRFSRQRRRGLQNP